MLNKIFTILFILTAFVLLAILSAVGIKKLVAIIKKNRKHKKINRKGDCK